VSLQHPAQKIVPAPPRASPQDEESLEVWGFKDTRFQIDPSGTVELTGNRYELSGQKLPSLLPWVCEQMQVKIDPLEVAPQVYPPHIPASRATPALRAALAHLLSPAQITEDAPIRLRHGHGHTQQEMFEVKHGGLPRVPDVVVFPETEEQVVALVGLAREQGACLIPYGGGTNVTDALQCPVNEERPILSVDLRRLNRVLWIDPVNRMACIQAGAAGRELMSSLAEHGFTLGHEPDSVEFSTLGGWIATHASGMKKNRYGNIEEIVLDMNVVTADGTLTRQTVGPRESVGLDPRRMLFGSEGTLGIITSAVVKLFPLPEVQRYGSLLFPSFERGVQFLYELNGSGFVPASVRLVDNQQFQLSMALKPAKTGAAKWKAAAEKLVVTKLKGFDPGQMVACTMVFEGSREEVSRQERGLYALASKHGGMKAGSENGRRGYLLTFGIAYIRDFVMRHHVIAESFETSVPWSQILPMYEAVKRRINAEHAKRGLPGRPFVTARVTQVYPTGAAVYFYYAYYARGVERPSETYAEIEALARAEILESGGTLSHHHGVGKLRRGFLPAVHSPAALAWNRQAKAALDPENLFASGNQLLTSDLPARARRTGSAA
jgi:alkyldihydroxyacetonephosphate synthase